MTDLIAFLTARLSEDDADALAASTEDIREWWDGEGYVSAVGGPYIATGPYICDMVHAHSRHVARWDPARVLAEVAAKRALLDALAAAEAAMDQAMRDKRPDAYATARARTSALREHTRILAAVYADHPEYDESWKP